MVAQDCKFNIISFKYCPLCHHYLFSPTSPVESLQTNLIHFTEIQSPQTRYQTFGNRKRYSARNPGITSARLIGETQRHCLSLALPLVLFQQEGVGWRCCLTAAPCKQQSAPRDL